jgi:uncharacterized membrane protein
MLKKSIYAVLALTMVLGVAACGGGSSTTVKETATQGQQLLDLKEAYDKGVITEKEYKSTKTKILKS